MIKNEREMLRFWGRVWNIVQFAVLITASCFIWAEMLHAASICVLAVLIIGWVKLYKLRAMDVEKPYYRLWLNFVDGILSLSILGSIFLYNYVHYQNIEILLGVGCIFLFFYVIW